MSSSRSESRAERAAPGSSVRNPFGADRLLGAVCLAALGGAREGRGDPVEKEYAMSAFVFSEDLGREFIAASVANAALGVQVDA